MNMDFFFNRRSRPQGWLGQQDPQLEMPQPLPPKRSAPQLSPPDGQPWSHRMSPRQMADWAHEMYLAGAMSWQEYQIAMPSELHPDYNSTIGALTGEPARPDHPRDMLKEWEERLAFTRRHNAWDAGEVRHAERIVVLLRRQAVRGRN